MPTAGTGLFALPPKGPRVHCSSGVNRANLVHSMPPLAPFALSFLSSTSIAIFDTIDQKLLARPSYTSPFKSSVGSLHNNRPSFVPQDKAGTIKQPFAAPPLAPNRVVSRDMIRRILADLRKQNRVECLGRGPSTKWRKRM